MRALGTRFGWTLPESLNGKLSSIRRRPLLAMISIRFLFPAPLGLKNYGLAMCNVGLVPYTLAGVVSNLPFSVLWASTGASCCSLAEALLL